MDQYDASLARACLEYTGLNTLYTGQVPEDFKVPSLYFPPNEDTPNANRISGYQRINTVYALVYGKDSEQAWELANKITDGIMCSRLIIRVYNEDGSFSGNTIKLDNPIAKVVDEGVAQVMLRYRVSYRYPSDNSSKAKQVGINMRTKK